MDYVLHITDECNFRCKYCYENKCNKKLSFENIKSLINIIAQNKEKNPTLTFYGGEPLLEKEIIYKTVEYVREIEKKEDVKFNFKINTNGYLIDDDFLEFAERNDFYFCYSIDGNKEAHDANRVTAGGIGTFDIVKENAKKVLDAKVKIVAMMVVNRNNIEYLGESVRYLFSLGFENVLFALDYSDKWIDSDLEIIKREYLKLSELYYEKTMNEDSFYMFPFENKIDAYISEKKRCLMECNLGYKSVNISTDGKVYPCMQLVDNSNYVIGDCVNGIDVEKRANLKKVEEYEVCKECLIKDRCKHTCACVNKLSTGDVTQLSPFVCETERIIIEIADEVANRLYKAESSMFLHKKYNKMYPLIDMLERKMKNEHKAGER